MIILTGFGPYGVFKSNLSGEIVKSFSYREQEIQYEKTILPVSWRESIDSYKTLFLKIKTKPDLVVLLGIHSSQKYHFEKYGWNFKMGVDIKKKFKFGIIKVNFYPWIKTLINLNKVYTIIKEKSDFKISNYGGSYLCNYLYYWALYLSKKEYPVVFIHIPVKGNLTESIKKVEVALKAIIKTHLNQKL